MQVVAALAAALNADPALAARGVRASGQGRNLVITRGHVDAIALADSGLVEGTPEVPALGGIAALALGACLGGTGWVAAKGLRPRCGSDWHLESVGDSKCPVT